MRTIDVRKLASTGAVAVTEGEGYFPVVAALSDKDLVAVLRGGAGHLGIGGCLDVVLSSDSGRTWSLPSTVADSEWDDRNPALGVAADGTVILSYYSMGSYDSEGKWEPSSGKADTRLVRSQDGGKTWSGDDLIDYRPINGASPFGKIRDVGGAMTMPVYGGPILGNTDRAVKADPPTSPTYLLRSTDNGRTWGDPTLVALGLNEADFLVLPSGEWVFAARTEKEGAIDILHSSDDGRSWRWTCRATGEHEHPPDLTLLENGWILLVFGHRHEPFGVQGMISKDGGCTWGPDRLVLEDGLHCTDIGYPSTARLAGGRLATLFYSAGSASEPSDPYRAINVSCRAICYDEDELVGAVG